MNGSGMHVHQSLVDAETGQNAFADGHDHYGMSALARQFIAGQLAHARGMCAVLAPLVNSYKRLVPGYEAPVYVSWGQINRSALIRVPQVQTRPARVHPPRAALPRSELQPLPGLCRDAPRRARRDREADGAATHLERRPVSPG